jgi:hypothetical protein
MSKLKASDDQLKPDGLARRASEEPKQDEDTEGHMFQPDLGTSRHLAKARSADIERELRERQRQKEARPNRR